MIDSATTVKENHIKKVLLVEDSKEYYRPIKRWLKAEGLEVILATCLEEAITRLQNDYFHVAVVDICLDENDTTNEDGIRFLSELTTIGLNKIIPILILTSRATTQNMYDATQQYGARILFKQPDYGAELKKRLRVMFEQDVKIRFDLPYEISCDNLLPVIAREIKQAEGENIVCSAEVLTEQTRDLIGKLYFEAKSIYFRKLNPGLTGAAVLLVHPTWEYGMAPAQVVKIGRHDKIQTEASNYDRHVRHYLPFSSVQVTKAYTRDLGGISYSFMGNFSRAFEEFDTFYARERAPRIIEILENLVSRTCSYWYEERSRERADLRSLYYKALNLEEGKLVERIKRVVPNFDSHQKDFILPLTGEPLINPLSWMEKNEQSFIRPVFISITHGDLTGRNIMVEPNINTCWLIDFYRTYRSHILRDFIILETDIKYRLLPTPSLEDFIHMEQRLLSGDYQKGDIGEDHLLSPDLEKAARAVHYIHHMAVRTSMSVSGQDGTNLLREDYLRSLLMGTLNVVRLRHIPEERKQHALYSAHLICQQLDQLPSY